VPNTFQRDLLTWWSSAEPFIEAQMPSSVGPLRNEAARLSKILDSDPSFVVCVLGQSAVGKSTLLNALVEASETILPAGGVGPLTALATEVRYSDEPHFEVVYRDRKQLDGFRLQLERELARRERSANEQPIAEQPNADAANAEVESDTRAFDELVRQLTQLVAGDQFAELPLSDVLAGLRAILGYRSDWEPDPATERRIDTARELVTGADPAIPRVIKASEDDGFTAILQQHVAGYLAPLVERLKVGFPFAGLDRNVVLVDLPGIGVANDRYRTITTDYVREQAQAVVLVVDRAGPTQSTMDLLRDSGYWDRLLLSSSDPETDPLTLLMVVTKIDDVAREERLRLPHPRPTLHDVFIDVRARTRVAMRTQASNCFSVLGTKTGNSEAIDDARRDASSTLLRGLEVHPVSAHQFRLKASENDPDEERPFIADALSTGIPELVGRINSLALANAERRRVQVQAVVRRFTDNVVAVLEQIESRWSTETQSSAGAAKLREELDTFLEPRKIEVAARGGAFREYLDTTFSVEISRYVLEARLSAQIEVNKYLSEMRQTHWGTLKATVVRGGAFVSSKGRRVDLAGDIAQRFQEPMAAVWSRKLLTSIRKRTRDYATALQSVVEEVCVWADQQAETEIQKQTLERQRTLMKTRVALLSEVGNDAVDDLKDTIKRELMKCIEPAIRKRCETFRDRGDAYGPGVKQRILELFDELASSSVTAAAEPAEKLLQRRFGAVRDEINASLDSWGDPLQETADAIVEREEQRRLRSDAQRRRHVLETAGSLRGTLTDVTNAA
jgi:GTP-binding protein EngB required for normal cell division